MATLRARRTLRLFRHSSSSAFFELFLFKFFNSGGFRVVEIEPRIPGITGRPDFLVESHSAGRFFVEATCPPLYDKTQIGRNKRNEEIKHAINAIKVPNHYLVLEKIRSPIESFSKKSLIEAIEKWISSDPPDDSRFEYNNKGCELCITLVARPGRDVNRSDYRAIGMEVGEGYSRSPGAELKNSLETKAAKFKSLPLPYVIAINAAGFRDSEDDYIAATYGSEAVSFYLGPEGAQGEPEFVRQTNGLFNDGGRVRKANVSAVAFFNGVAPWSVADRRSCVVHNAYAEAALTHLTFGGDAYVPEDGTLRKTQGYSVGELMGLTVAGS